MAEKHWVALLRAVNLGKHKKLAMADLRALLELLGYGDVRTLLQSGNAVFTTTKGTASTVGADIEKAIARELGVDTTVFVRSAREIDSLVDANPFTTKRVDPKELHAVFLAAKPKAAKLKTVDPDDVAPDEFADGNRVLYVRLPNGVMGSKLPNWDKTLGVAATMRTWNTVLRIQSALTG